MYFLFASDFCCLFCFCFCSVYCNINAFVVPLVCLWVCRIYFVLFVYWSISTHFFFWLPKSKPLICDTLLTSSSQSHENEKQKNCSDVKLYRLWANFGGLCNEWKVALTTLKLKSATEAKAEKLFFSEGEKEITNCEWTIMKKWGSKWIYTRYKIHWNQSCSA